MKALVIFLLSMYQLIGMAQNQSTMGNLITNQAVLQSCQASCCVLGQFNSFTASEFSQIKQHLGTQKTDLRKLQSFQYLFTDAMITYDQLVETISLMKRDRMKLKLIEQAANQVIDAHRLPLLIFLFDKKSSQRRVMRLTRDKKITINTLNTP